MSPNPPRPSKHRATWRALLLAGCAWLGLAPAAQARENPAQVARVPLTAGGAVQLELPAGFTALNKVEIEQKFARGNAPKAVWGNANRTVTVAITDSPTRVEPAQLPELKAVMEQALPRAIPNLAWLDRSLISVQDRDWIRLELTSSALDTDIHNLMYLTSQRGHMWGVNYNATRDSFAANRGAFDRSMASIRFED